MNAFFQTAHRQTAQTIRAWLDGVADLMHEPYQWILHPSVWRLRWIGIFIFLGNPLFYLIWTELLPQPFESLTVRLCISAFGLALLIRSKAILRGSRFWQRFYAFTLFVQLPLAFLGMAYMNGFNDVWLGSCSAMVLIYYQATDWRLANIGVLTATVLVSLYTFFSHINNALISQSHHEALIVFTFVFIFSWLSALVLGGSTANILKQNIKNTAFNLGVMAHELRTPIASISLLNHVLKKNANAKNDADLDQLAIKLGLLVKIINQHIDDQIANSKQSRGNVPTQKTSALTMVQQVISNYPFLSDNERNAVTIACETNFYFSANPALYTQVLNNLLKNAIRAMRAKEISEFEMQLTINIVVDSAESNTRNKQYLKLFSKQSKTLGNGRITITDNGCGIEPSQLQRVLEPFVSSADGLGHGLGLPFCKRVLDNSGGQLTIQSQLNIGTSITLTLPIYQPEN